MRSFSEVEFTRPFTAAFVPLVRYTGRVLNELLQLTQSAWSPKTQRPSTLQHDFERAAFDRRFREVIRILTVHAGDGFKHDEPPHRVIAHDHQVIEGDQRAQRLPQGVDQCLAIAAGDQGLGNLEQRTIFEGAIGGGHLTL